MNGATTSVVDDTDVLVDGNPCTDDLCSNGNASNPNKNVGFSCGPSLMCDGAGNCVGCVLDTDCPAAPNVCQVRVCMTGGVCGNTNVATGTPVTDAAGNCQKKQCNGLGDIETLNDDNDKPVDNNPCTQDLCSAGVPTNPPFASGTTCSVGTGTMCDGFGACVECVNASTCPGDDTDCHARTCLNGVCGIANQPEFTTATMQSTSPDCHTVVCDGAGSPRNDIDDGDVPSSPSVCQTVTCMAGNIMTTNSSPGTACSQNGGVRCDNASASICVPTFMVVRLGDASAALTNAATAVFVEERYESTGDVYRTITLPTAAGTPKPFTLSGTADTSGGLTLSTDGHYVTLAGFRAAIPTASVANTTAATVARSVARIDASGGFDTSTTLGTAAFTGDNPRSAITTTGTQFWVAGNASNSNRGVYYAGSLGATTSTLIESATNATRICQIASNQLYCDANSGTLGLFAVGSGLPTMTIPAAPFSTPLTGTVDAAASYYAIVFTDTNTLYVADDRAPPNGGIQKWTSNGGLGGTWTKQGTFNTGITTGIQGSPHTPAARAWS